MRLCLPGCLVLVPVALSLLQAGCERSTGFCQTTADCAAGLACHLESSTCVTSAAPDLAGPVQLPHLGMRIQNPAGSLPGDYFGYAVAATSTYAVFGSYLARGAMGAAYVADLTSTSCGVPMALAAPDTPVAFDYFGVSVAASGNTIAVGAHNKDGGKGAVYVYTKVLGAWSAVPTKLVAADGVAGDLFGISVSLNGDTLAVGAYNKASTLGAAYVFTRTPATGLWAPSFRLPSPTEAPQAALDYFGLQVAATANFVAVGSPGRQANHGAVYLYKADPIQKWIPAIATPLFGTTLNEQFGSALAMDQSTLVIGSGGYSPSMQQVGQGRVFLYDLLTPGSLLPLTIADPGPRQRFGAAVSLASVAGSQAQTLLVGAPGRDQALVFRRVLGQPFSPTAVLDVPPDTSHASFGATVATTGTQHVIGIRGLVEDVGAAFFFPDN